MTTTEPKLVAGLEPATLDAAEAQALAERHGLMPMGVRPPLGRYVRDVWRKRHFVWTLAASEAYATNQKYVLGQVWSILNPILLVGSYYLIFGVLLQTRGGTTNYVAFLTVGIFLFSFISSSLTGGAKAVVANIGLVRSLRFPRAVLPISVTLTEMLHTLPAIGVLVILMLVTGEPIQVKWLLLPVAVVLLFLNILGIVFFLARIVERSRDLGNLIPVSTRLLRYVSGVFYSIQHYAGHHPVVYAIMAYQPVSSPLTITREALLLESPVHLIDWVVAAVWALVLPVVGFIFFWRAEARYGRG